MAKIIEMEISKIKYDKDLYPRFKEINEVISAYQLNLDKLPPIIVQKEELILIDGYHRLKAYEAKNRKTIKVKLLDIPKNRILWKATELNAKHGYQLTGTEKGNLARRFIEEGIQEDLDKIAKVLAVEYETVREWTKNLRQKLKEEEKYDMLKLFLECMTDREIHKELNISLGKVNNLLQLFRNTDFCKTEHKDDFLKEIVEIVQKPPESLKIYDVWNFSGCDDRYGTKYDGRIPGQIIENILWYYTKPFDIVIDPMAGSGTTYDVCKAMYRRCRCYDVKPFKEHTKKHDARQPFPKECTKPERPTLIFLDPPYWSMKKDEYSEDSISALPLDEFYIAINTILKNCKKILKKRGYMAFLIQNQTGKGKGKFEQEYLDHVFEVYKIFLKLKFTPIRRISCPMSTQPTHGQQTDKAKEDKRMLGLVRDLLIMRRD